jgi:hypothetical protein
LGIFQTYLFLTPSEKDDEEPTSLQITQPCAQLMRLPLYPRFVVRYDLQDPALNKNFFQTITDYDRVQPFPYQSFSHFLLGHKEVAFLHTKEVSMRQSRAPPKTHVFKQPG